LEAALWNEATGWPVASYLLARERPINRAMLHALAADGLQGQAWRQAEGLLEAALTNPALKSGAIDALTICLYAEDWHRAAMLLLRCGGPLTDKLIVAANGLAELQPWIPLASAALTGQVAAIRVGATRLACSRLVEVIGDRRPLSVQ
jgi:hypothetical protein